MPYVVFKRDRCPSFRTSNLAKKYARQYIRNGIKKGYTVTEEVIEKEGSKCHYFYLFNSKGTKVNGCYVKKVPGKGRITRPSNR